MSQHDVDINIDLAGIYSFTESHLVTPDRFLDAKHWHPGTHLGPPPGKGPCIQGDVCSV
jgi:hypothetical protein